MREITRNEVTVMKLIEKSASKKMNINDIPDPRPSDGTWGTPIPNSYGNSHCNKTLSGNHYFDEVIDYRLSGETPDTRMVDKVYTGVYKCKYCGIIDDSRQPKEQREIKEMLKIIKGYAEKFVNKVEAGRARSRETYADMKHVLQLLESELKEEE